MLSDAHRDLIRRIGAHDAAAETELIKSFKSRILILIHKALGYQNDSNTDLLHEVMIAIVQALRAGHFDLEKGTALESYVYGVAKNKIRDFLKTEKKQMMLRSNLEREPHLNIRENIELERKEAAKMLRYEIGKLKVKYQEVIYLRYFEELSITEISEKIGLPHRRVSERINYAIKLLKKRLDGGDFSQ